MRFQMSCLECDSQIPESISQMEFFYSEIMWSKSSRKQ